MGYNVADYTTATIAGTAGTIFGLSTEVTSKPGLAKSFIGILETAQVRARGDGTPPTSTEGVLINAGDVVILTESEFALMQFIRTGATSGVLKGHFLTVEPEHLR